MSDEKGKEKAQAEAEKIIEHWSHKHPLSLVETRTRDYCYGCEQDFSSGEEAYGCSIKGCGYEKLLHEECAEMPTKIRYTIAHNPHHILILRHQRDLGECRICERYIWSIGYKCTNLECRFKMHIRCAHVGGGATDAAANDIDEQSRNICHPSHPEHELKLVRRRFSFKCDACGTSKGIGTSYTCTAEACQYWIHERCASLPGTIQREDHHHSLSISFHAVLEYIKYNYKCDVCNKGFLPKYWIYHCQLCSVVVHLKCAFNKSSHTLTLRDDAKDIIHLPANDVAEELIAPLMMRQGGAIPHDDVMINVKYKFPHHQHQLILISSSHHDQNKEEKGDDDDYEDDGKRSEVLICDGCITPIFSSSSSYMSCSNEHCNYNLHMACFNLPPPLPSHPAHHKEDHPLILQSFGKQPWKFKFCIVCGYRTNGLYYACTKCDFIADIKCACLGDTIYHAAHPQHLLKYVTKEDIRKQSRDPYSLRRLSCAAGCGGDVDDYDCYTCDACSSNFIVHVKCAMLPASVTNRKWDKKHPLLLTYDANLNHPGDFYCDQCEREMNPKSWMYHCRHCDLSFHPKCFPVTSGGYRNVKFGQQYVIAAAHRHTLTYQILTTKRRCDLCDRDNYGWDGFQCASCNFFICLYYCGPNMIRIGGIKAVG